MEFEDWDSFMEPQLFTGESSDTAEASSSSSEARPSSTSLIADVATIVLSTVAKTALPAAAFLYAYQTYTETTCLCAYKGSCHCESVQFEFQAPRRLKIQTNRHQSRYNDVMHRFIKVKTSNFEIVKGEDHMNTFQVEPVHDPVPSSSASISVLSLGTAKSNQSSDAQGARVFCRRCGVHILHAPSPESKYIKVNITCVANPVNSSTTKAFQKSAISVANQTAKTIQEVASRTALWMTHLSQELMQSEEYKNHPVVQTLLGVGNAVLEVLQPYALGSKVYKGSSANDLTTSTTKPPSTTVRRTGSNISDDLSSVSTFSTSQPVQSRLELFHAAATPKQANVVSSSAFGTSQTHLVTPASYPQQ